MEFLNERADWLKLKNKIYFKNNNFKKLNNKKNKIFKR